METEAEQIIVPMAIKRSRKWRYIIIFALVTIIAVGGGVGGWIYSHRRVSPIPKAIVKNVGFTLYYPIVMPANYNAEYSSFMFNSGVVYYSLKKNDSFIYVNEQAAPKTPPDFQILIESLSFKKIDVLSGSAVLGLNAGKPTAIVLTNTTLITITSTKNTPIDVLTDFVKSLHSL